VRALPLAAGINVDGHYFRYTITLLVGGTAVIKTPEGVIVGFHIFATNINKNSGKKIKSDPTPWPPGGDFYFFIFFSLSKY
jgi:hypothetical protein